MGDKAGRQQDPGDKTVVSREEEEQGGVDDVSDSREPHRHTKVTREDSPHADARSEHDHVHTSKDCDETMRENKSKRIVLLGFDCVNFSQKKTKNETNKNDHLLC